MMRCVSYPQLNFSFSLQIYRSLNREVVAFSVHPHHWRLTQSFEGMYRNCKDNLQDPVLPPEGEYSECTRVTKLLHLPNLVQPIPRCSGKGSSLPFNFLATSKNQRLLNLLLCRVLKIFYFSPLSSWSSQPVSLSRKALNVRRFSQQLKQFFPKVHERYFKFHYFNDDFQLWVYRSGMEYCLQNFMLSPYIFIVMLINLRWNIIGSSKGFRDWDLSSSDLALQCTIVSA